MSSKKRKQGENKTKQTNKNESSSSSDNNYEVEAIVGRKRMKDGYKYLIHWKGFPSSEDTWEPESALNNCQDLIKEYNNNLTQISQRKNINLSEVNKSEVIYAEKDPTTNQIKYTVIENNSVFRITKEDVKYQKLIMSFLEHNLSIN